MNRIFAFFFLLLLYPACYLSAQSRLLTVAESSDFTSTARYDDVFSFISELGKISDKIRIDTIATSVEGRAVPLLIIGDPVPDSPENMKDDERMVVYIQANIHAGEVEGKEASLMFARDLLMGKGPDVLDDLVILICPNLNPDGNEKIDPLNRAYQDGPVNGVGVRYNAQMLDLNRDAMKAESPEINGVIANVFSKWDPALFMDCHTTNGSYHVEPVTFTWMVNPNGDNSLITYMHKSMMPVIHTSLLEDYNVENCYYGEFVDMMDHEKGWIYEAPDPRYMTNYYGLRNRLAILNENYVYAAYEERVKGCYYLIRSVTEYSATHKEEMLNLLKEADHNTVLRGTKPLVTDSLGIEFKVRALPEKAVIKTFEAEPDENSVVWPPFRKTDRQKTVSVPYLIDYYPVRNARLPYAYIFSVNDAEVIDLLLTHGISIERLTEKITVEVEEYIISDLKGSARLNQGHYTNSVKGRFIRDTKDFPEGTILIRTAQPLANLASYLLEPESTDGLLSWNFFDKYLVPQWGTGYNPCPVYKIVSPVNLKTSLLE